MQNHFFSSILRKVGREIKRPFRRAYGLRVEWARFRRETQNATPRFQCRWRDRWACVEDKTGESYVGRHVYASAWVTRALAETRPLRHVDISSLGFCELVGEFVPMEFYDYCAETAASRKLKPANTAFPFTSQSLESFSSIGVTASLGLGRYGEQLAVDGDLIAMREMSRVLKPGGNLFFVAPIGANAIIRFNACRIYTPSMVIETFREYGLTLKEWVLIPEDSKDGGLVINPSAELLQRQHNALGCFWLTKPT